MKAVIDTNVFVSSFFGGKPREIINLWKSGEITLCLSPAIIEEYVSVLERLGLDADEDSAAQLDLFALGHHLLFTAKTPALKVVRADPADDKFIECAVALKTEAVVTGDKSLRAVGNYRGIKILNPGEFLSLARKSS
jgi:uncharacterized protein